MQFVLGMAFALIVHNFSWGQELVRTAILSGQQKPEEAIKAAGTQLETYLKS